jgi:Fe-S cluster assembly protein SufD
VHVQAAADAVLRVDEIELQANNAQVFHHKYADLAKAAQLSWFQMGFAGGLNRHYWQADLNDVEAHCQLGSACMAMDKFQAHHVINVQHHSPRSFSSQLFKSIALDQARYSFNGLVRMDKGADESSANQQNANLQLSPNARIHSRPQLDIHTDDVIATHGSATGQADPNELYYLRTRGLDKEQAEQLIVSGFLQEVSGQFHSDVCRRWAAEQILSRLS